MRLRTIAVAVSVFLGAGAVSAQSQTRCFEVTFPDSAPAFSGVVSGDTLVLSELSIGEFEDLMPGGRRAFLSAAEYRTPEPLTYHSPAWRLLGADSIVIRPLLFMAALIWTGELTERGMQGQVEIATDEVGAPTPLYRFHAAEIGCGGEPRREPAARGERGASSGGAAAEASMPATEQAHR